MDKDKIRVIDKLLEQCRQAFIARKPLILVDTEEIELMERLAQRFVEEKLVDQFQQVRARLEETVLLYYRNISGQPDALERSTNYSCDSKVLEELALKGGSMTGGMVPQLLVLHLTRDKEDPYLINRLRRYVQSYVRSCAGVLDNASAIRSSCVLLHGDPTLMPKDLAPYVQVLTVEYPREWEIQEILIREARNNGYKLDEALAKELARDMAGFSVIRVEEYIRRLLWNTGADGKPVLFHPKARKAIVQEAKAQAVRSTGGLLTLYPDKGDDQKDKQWKNDLGGMKTYKDWALKAGRHINAASDYALDKGVGAMKGVLLCGVPGCGKSEAAKILKQEWKLPMLPLEVDQLMGSKVGESEEKMRQALAQAEAMAPCILWIDEIDKGFSGANSTHGDGGVFKRMFGRLLTWMQENKKPCFIFATANDISQLPPEFFRSGRFDALFSVFLPTNDECKEIFREQMRRAEQLRQDTAEEKGLPEPGPLFDKMCDEETALQAIMDMLMQGKNPDTGEGVKFLSGADIEKIVQNALKKEGLAAPIEVTSWLGAVEQVIQDPTITTSGSGYANMDEIAACYVRLLRKNFVAVSGQDQILFRKEHYHCTMEKGEPRVSYEGKCPLEKPYDRALFNSLRPRIETIASGIEAQALRRLY